MPIRAKRPQTEYVNPDPGLYIAVCADIEGPNLAPGYEPGDPEREVIVLWWLLNKNNPKTGRPFELQRKCTLSMFAGKGGSGGSTLYQIVKGWIGTALSQEEADLFDLEILLGMNCQLQVIHAKQGDKTYANVGGVLPLTEGQKPMSVPEDYTRRRDREGQ